MIHAPLFPQEFKPVLAKIESLTSLGRAEHYEVVYHDGGMWCSCHGSDTFKDGEQVKAWKLVEFIELDN